MWVKGWVGLGHRMLITTPEQLRERQPLRDESDTVCLVFDGRVDNREDLGKTLKSQGSVLRDDTDAELVLKSYLQWGEKAPIRILGDFAFAVWDGRLGALFCARDIFGIRPLNYYRGANFVLIASELHQLFHDPRVKRVPNEGMVAEYLSAEITHCEETLWEGILRLPPAHFMWVRPDGVEKRRYWDFDLSKEVRFKTDEEYAAQFLDLFRDSVRCRLRSSGPVGSYLSGGLDSSSVSVIASELLREQGRVEPLDTFSLIFPGMICDETEYIQATVQHAGLRSHLFPPVQANVEYYHQIASRYQDFPGWPNGGAMMTLPLQEGLRDAGTRVMLTGFGGNECVEGMDDDLAVLSSEGRLLELVSTARSQAAEGGPSWWRLAFDYGVRPLVPRTMKQALRSLLRRERKFECLPWEFQQRTELRHRLEASAHPAGASPVQQVMYSCFCSGWANLFHEITDREGGFLGVELRHPFLDRRLAEFCFAIPEQQRSQNGLTKIVLRNALQGRLPESVIQRKIQSEFTPVIKKTFDTIDFKGCLSCVAIEGRGWIIPSQQLSCVERFRAGESLNVWKLWAAIGMEIWCSRTQDQG